MTEVTTQPDDDAFLQAFLYVQGELSADDAEAFEQQMLDDADLCEKVAEASLLSSAVVECRDATAIVRNRPAVHSTGLRSLAVIVTGCCCAALMMFVVDPSDTSSAVDAGTSDGTEASVLVAAWIDNADRGNENEEVEEDEQNTEPPIDTELTVPDWMLAGVSELGMKRTPGSTTPQPNNDDPELL